MACTDRVAEFLITWSDKSGWSYKGGFTYKGQRIQGNSWEPFWQLEDGFTYLQCLPKLPAGLYHGVVHFPSSSLLTLLFFPLLIFIIPIYDAVALNNFFVLINGALPFFAGFGVLLYTAYMRDKSRGAGARPLEFDD